MKKKRKRSASSSSSSTTSSRNSSSSSSSSSRRRSKKKKKKRRRSDRGSKPHRRISSRESRRSVEGKSDKDRKEKEEDEVEWYPAPPNTSATFLNQKGGPGFRERDEEEGMEKNTEDRLICHLYSLSGASEDEESESSRRQQKRGVRENSRRISSPSRSSEREQRGSKSGGRRDQSEERGKEDDRRDRDSKRRSSLDENRKRKVSCSSAESEYPRKSNFKPEYLGNSGSASKHTESRVRRDSSNRNSFDGGRHENTGREAEEKKKGQDSRKGRGEEGRSEAAGNHKQSSVTSAAGGRPKKDLPPSLLDIFSQIAQFEKEKGVGPK